MERDETMRRDLAQAMGLAFLDPNPPVVGGIPLKPWVFRRLSGRGVGRYETQGEMLRAIEFFDPLNDAEDAEALWTWLVGQRCYVEMDDRSWEQSGLITVRVLRTGPMAEVLKDYRAGWREGHSLVNTTDEPDPARRRRRALVEAAWQATRATASAAEEA